MKAAIHSETGPPDVLRVVDRPVPEPGEGEVRVRVHVSGVNPTDWKLRRGASAGQSLAFPEVVPHQDGAGTVDALGPGVEGLQVGQRVWVWLAAWQRAGGTAQEYVALPRDHVVPLPDGASFDLGASLGIPALTAHRCLTVGEGFPERLAPEVLSGRTVLVAGGAGAVGNAAIQLARWAGATVVTTVSSPEKADLARRAGALAVVNYRTEDTATSVRRAAPGGVDLVVEVSPAVNAPLDAEVMSTGATIAVYANNGGDEVVLPVRPNMTTNARWQFVLIYTMPDVAKHNAVQGVSSAVAAGALRVGDEAGLPLHRFRLDQVAEAHATVEGGAVGKVLVDLA